MDTVQIIPYFYIDGVKAALKQDEKKEKEAFLLAEAYQNNGADGIFMIDTSTSKEGCKAFISMCREIVRTMEIPLYIGTAISCAEDAEKYLNTGAAKVITGLSSEAEKTVWKEAAKRFGKERILAADYCKDSVTFGTLEIPKEQEYVFVQASEQDNFYEWKQQLKLAGIKVMTYETAIPWSEFKLNRDGLVPCIVQDYRTNQVLMMAYMNEASFEETVALGRMCYYSRSRQERWLKGETSGHYQYVKSLYLDCDNDTILAKVAQIGAACHTGSYSCFFKPLVDKRAVEEG